MNELLYPCQRAMFADGSSCTRLWLPHSSDLVRMGWWSATETQMLLTIGLAISGTIPLPRTRLTRFVMEQITGRIRLIVPMVTSSPTLISLSGSRRKATGNASHVREQGLDSANTQIRSLTSRRSRTRTTRTSCIKMVVPPRRTEHQIPPVILPGVSHIKEEI